MLMVESKQNRARLSAGGGAGAGGGGRSGLELKSCGGEWRGEWPEMVSPQPHQQHQQQQQKQKQQPPSRINLLELKAQIVKRVGSERANQYFGHVRSFISSRLRKPELDKLVLLTIGKENVALHNKLIIAVLNNAIRAEVPPPAPPPPTQDVSKPVKGIRRKPLSPSIPNDDAIAQLSLPPPPSSWSNGDSLVSSPRKGRSCVRDRKANKDRLSPFGLREVTATLSDDNAARIRLNEDLKSPDLSRPLQEIDGGAQQLHAEQNCALVPPVKRPRTLSCIEPASVESGRGLESGPLESKENVVEREREEVLLSAGKFIRAPLGIPFCTGSVGAARRPPFRAFSPLTQLQFVDGAEEELMDASELPDGETLHRRMEQIATVDGLAGVSRDCADLLNHALDALLNRLIKACVELVGSKYKRDQERLVMSNDSGPVWHKNVREGVLSGMKLHQCLNGVWPAPTVEVLRSYRDKTQPSISLGDFKVAVDLNPQQLGEDWPVQLEKLSFRLFDH